ncbi:LarC family nickel insertion protein [Rhodoplanes sp. TEM]|uniref:LarC family nickel insertion protein n=1 Tax=Rhodoplanes tepidamans TaxID=200616 RepID=A0ABT5JG19_RHOTP|nr:MULTISPECIES: LarC family nickel insertion protein [Rhodoplanes]MDC7788650.1 LarC family nickel insertion protein [Rhodoplanes tepidamans]MDC7982437.1 LarC family nickel insertion protein [Rhodoplanes sp. TEM]MDQ0354991.1 uncharacterized protein (TIGR00299 family) protein [Rhodoplanes tepidamans]
MAERRHLHLDAVGGVAGDMFVAALLDALPDLRPRVMADLAAVLPADCGRPLLREGLSGGIAVLRFGLEDGAAAPGHRDHGPASSHAHSHDHHGHHHHHHHNHDHSHHHHSDHDHHLDHHHDHHHHDGAPAHFRDLVRMIEAADLSPGTAGQAVAILRRIAEAESRMHRVPLDAVHFHELADWDSLMDVVAAGSIAAALDGATWSVSDLPKGQGLVRTQHGLLPVPAPATAEILRGFRWRDDGIAGERVTPTGAAIVAHLVDAAVCGAPAPAGVLVASGSGAGTRDLPGMPNILRALVLDTGAAEASTSSAAADEVVVLCFDLDDMTGEEIAVAADRLRATAGVIDLTIGSRAGKKGRSAADVRLLVRPAAFEAVAAACFAETSTIGLRFRREQRLCLPRRAETVVVDGTTLRRKRAMRPGGDSVKVESDDLTGLDGLVARRAMKTRGEQGDDA